MDRVLGILKDKPPIESMFEVLETTTQHKKGDILYLTNEVFYNMVEKGELYAPYYKKIATFRQAFIGDMQEKINKAMGHDVMKQFAESVSNTHYPLTIYTEKKIYIRVNIFRQFIEWIKDPLKKQAKEDSNWLEEQLFGPKL